MPLPPVDPDSWDKVNFVIDAWTTGCDAPWYIYIETAKPALLKAFITLITFGYDDVLRGYFRPRGLYRRRTGKRKGKFVRRIPRFPEFGNMLGTHLPGAFEVKGFKWNSLGKTLWRIDGAMEQIRFFWLVAGIVEDFAFEWTSLLYESFWCLDDAVGRFSYSVPGFFGLPNDVWWIPTLQTRDYENAPPSWSGTRGRSGPRGCTVTAAFQIEKNPGHPPPTSFQVIVRGDTAADVFADSGLNDELDNGSGFGVAMGNVPPNTTFTIRVRQSGTPVANYGEGVVMAFEPPA